ncbi:flagellar motor protein MotB [Sphingobium sp. H39-3-25]|uniref:flagellar motor protein MotB n=1 Tax=Sphingobium arseniciresistens TaxID=3030834 RepID=UPI0023B899D6|nr:flagellar motor protein MotB [Sphingobium arseniciresistens]
MTVHRRARWATSFADLALLLLGFFVLLQASGSRSAQIISGVGAQFGARPMSGSRSISASTLFLPHEAMLTPAGQARISAIAADFRRSGGRVELASFGQDGAVGARFDAWDLAAARLGAVARAFRAAGIAEDRLRIRGLDQMDDASTAQGDTSGGQVIRIAPARR